MWLWQQEHSGREPRSEASPDLRAMMSWSGDACTGGPLCSLRGRSFAARIASESIGVCLVHYELDKSSVLDALSGRHMMVVDAIAISPGLPQSCQLQAELGIRDSLMQLAQCHSQRLQFACS